MSGIYLDYNATTPVHPEVLEAMLPYFSHQFGNASTIYKFGQSARKAVEEARAQVARLIGADEPDEIVFTSCATESNNMVIKGALEVFHYKGKRIVSSAFEHSAIRNVLIDLSKKKKADFVPIPVDVAGLVNVAELEAAAIPETVLVSVMMVNNEVGTIQPIYKISQICKKNEIPFHTDAAQAAGKIKIDVNELGVDYLSLSAHKFGGPKGIGVLYIRKGARMEPLLTGGNHEKNRRAGTENVPLIVGMGKAAELAQKYLDNNSQVMKKNRDLLEKLILESVPQTFVNGGAAPRVCNTSNICFPCVDSSSLLIALDVKGVSCSNGSACAAGNVEASHVLLAMGLPQDQAHSSLRLSIGPTTSVENIKKTVLCLTESVAALRRTNPLWKEAVSK